MKGSLFHSLNFLKQWKKICYFKIWSYICVPQRRTLIYFSNSQMPSRLQ